MSRRLTTEPGPKESQGPSIIFMWQHSSPGRGHCVVLARKVVRTYRRYMCFERICSCTIDFLKQWRHYYSCTTSGLRNPNLTVKLEKGATSKCGFTEMIWVSAHISPFPRGRSPPGWLLGIADTAWGEAALRHVFQDSGCGTLETWLSHVGSC